MNSDNKNAILSSLNKSDDKAIYDNENTSDFIITEQIFNENNNNQLTNKNIYTEEVLEPKKFGKYSNEYIEDINNFDKLFFLENRNLTKFMYQVSYLDINKTIFNFVTGNDKIGKTFGTLFFSRLDKNNIYFNIKKYIELEQNQDNLKIINIFFYEISKIFKEYKDYTDFAKLFLEDIKNIIKSQINFNSLLIKFIQSIESYFLKNKHTYSQLLVVLDEVEMDETKEELFKRNYNLINELHNRKYNFFIQFTIISPINDNYVKNGIILALNLFIKNAGTETSNFRKDPLTGRINYAYIYYCNFCFSNEKEFNLYKSKLLKRNINNIPEKFLELFNYSLFHFNNLESIYRNNNDKDKATEIEKYIKKIESEGEQLILNYYEDKNKIYRYDLNKLNEINNIINEKIEVDVEKLMEMLLFIPIKIISFQIIIPEFEYLELKNAKFKVSFKYNLYNNSISKYLSLFNSPDYFENKNIKPGSKGDKLEEKVIEEIKNGYFRNFIPDKVIEVKSILTLFKNKNSYEIQKFQNIKQYRLIMIIQSQPNAQRYDIAFLQKINKDDYQLILGQITKKKKEIEMLQYKSVKKDCLDFSNFFNDPEIDIKVSQYHFIFIFQGGVGEDTNSMDFCKSNNIRYIKFFVKNNQAIFTSASNQKIKELIFDDKSFSLVEIIIPYRKDEKDYDSASSSEYSLTGEKRQKISGTTKAKYFLGTEIYNKIKKILGKDFKLINECFSLEENVYFQVFYKKIKKGQKNEKVYFLVYKLNEKKKIINLLDDKDNKEKSEKLFEKIEEPNFNIKSFKIVDNDRSKKKN